MNLLKSMLSHSTSRRDINIDSEQFQKELNNWKIPKIPTHEIYKQGKFNLKNDYTIKVTENTISVLREHETIRLLSQSSIEKCREKYNYLHIGLVQVAAKPISGKALDTSIFMCLRDCRFLNFDDSLLTMVESSNFCNNGPIYFNYYPNFCVSLLDRHILDVLTLNIKTLVPHVDETNSVPLFNLMYRVHCKAMNSAFNTKAGKVSKREKTVLFQVDLLRSGMSIPKVVNWNEINIPNMLEFPELASQETSRNCSAEMVEQSDGSVIIRFSRSSSRKQDVESEISQKKGSFSQLPAARASSSSTTEFLKRTDYLPCSSTSIPSETNNFQALDISSNTSHGFDHSANIS